MKNRFEGKVAVITGSARGMGKETARQMAEEGASIVLTDIDQNAIDKTADEFRNAGYSFIPVVCDISKRNQVDNLINETVKAFKKIDILINNAGLLLTAAIEETTDEIIEKTLDINVKGVLYAIRAVTPIMKKQKYGRIINVSSITGKNGDNSTTFVYGASKGALLTITRSVARQLGPHGITCNGIAPHAVMTEMMSYWTEEKKAAMAAKIPLGRLGTEGDMASLMCFLASDEAGFITGETININGGYYMD
ncbi:glucose 1-dehydrogenase [Treponema sp. OMZ 840]|uniref:SDR family NAD(P)-dependent oxidoreductase n=1 Tax=Treponema sp. OMZ 840 TaxID=244313 RepID=UPI003D8CEDBB